MNTKIILAAALAGLACLLSSVASAQDFGPNWISPPAERGFEQRVQANILPVREIAAMVRAQRGGDLVDVLRLDRDGRLPTYVLRWRFPNGVVADLRVNALTGQIVG